jgi:regulator of RNase E activity RraB
MAKIYAASKSVIDQDVAGELFRLLLAHTDDVAIGYDEFGTYFEVPNEVYEKAFPVAEQDTEPAPKKRGRPRKVEEPEAQE